LTRQDRKGQDCKLKDRIGHTGEDTQGSAGQERREKERRKQHRAYGEEKDKTLWTR